MPIAQINAWGLITSGMWGLLWYREIRGYAAAAWVLCAMWTGAMVLLLSFEKK